MKIDLSYNGMIIYEFDFDENYFNLNEEERLIIILERIKKILTNFSRRLNNNNNLLLIYKDCLTESLVRYLKNEMYEHCHVIQQLRDQINVPENRIKINKSFGE